MFDPRTPLPPGPSVAAATEGGVNFEFTALAPMGERVSRSDRDG
jgi:hypothetical protein